MEISAVILAPNLVCFARKTPVPRGLADTSTRRQGMNQRMTRAQRQIQRASNGATPQGHPGLEENAPGSPSAL
eukprot:6202921-Pleurochrysis_carterae.AAC.3